MRRKQHDKKSRQETTKPTQAVVDANQVTSPVDPVDPEVQQEFAEAAKPTPAWSRQLHKKLAVHHSQSPELTSGDIDAAWDRSDVGEEGPGGTVATPDQDVVEEIGEAVGLTFEDDEPVDGPGKLDRRDRRRFELDPVSSEDYVERQRETAEEAKRDRNE